MRRYGITLVLAAVIVGLVASSPGWAALTENSVYDWWITQSGWGSPVGQLLTYTDEGAHGYHGYTASPTYPGTWTNGDALSGMRVEYAGWAGSNTFGWYEYSGAWGSSSIDRYEIFDGSATTGTTWSSLTHGWYGDHTYTYPSRWGFYLGTSAGYWYSEDAQNDRTGYADQRHLEVFDHPTVTDAYVLCWEDMNRGSWGDDNSDTIRNTHLEFENATNYDYHGEPDYQDMILTYQRIRYGQGEWDDSPELGTWALVLCAGVLGGWLKSRRKED
jgi:hypothetical protein